MVSGSVYGRRCAEAVGDARRARLQDRHEHLGAVEPALCGGAEDGGEDVLRLRATRSTVASA